MSIIRGEATVYAVANTCAFLKKPDVDGTIFVQPSSVIGQIEHGDYPNMHTLLSKGDRVKFEAVPQKEANQCKWRCIDLSVFAVNRNEIYESIGVINQLDERTGNYGFVETDKGSLFFSSSVIVPKKEKLDVAKAFKVGQKVRFKARKSDDSSNRNPWKAIMVCSLSYKPPSSVDNKPVSKPGSTTGWLKSKPGSSNGRQRQHSITSSGGSAQRPFFNFDSLMADNSGAPSRSSTPSFLCQSPVMNSNDITKESDHSQNTIQPHTAHTGMSVDHFSLRSGWDVPAYEEETKILAKLGHQWANHMGIQCNLQSCKVSQNFTQWDQYLAQMKRN